MPALVLLPTTYPASDSPLYAIAAVRSACTAALAEHT